MRGSCRLRQARRPACAFSTEISWRGPVGESGAFQDAPPLSRGGQASPSALGCGVERWGTGAGKPFEQLLVNVLFWGTVTLVTLRYMIEAFSPFELKRSVTTVRIRTWWFCGAVSGLVIAWNYIK